jgi:hypothetical protein
MTQLTPRRFKPSNSVRNQWHVEPEFGTPPEALLDPAYWAHVSAQLRRGDIICALSEDNTYFSELLVIDAGKLFAKVIQLRCVQITAAQMLNVTVPEGYEIKFRGPKKWSVLRNKDVLKEDMEKPQAEAWLREHLLAMGVKAA